MMPRLLDLFSGRWGWSKSFAARGWECVGVDLAEPPEVPEHCHLMLLDVLEISADWITLKEFDFICASPPCEQFSVHGMKHFHPNPPYPELGLKLFNHTRALCESSGLPYVIENVRSAQRFVGNAVHHCGPFYLWGNAVPPLMPQNISKSMKQARLRRDDGKRAYACPVDRMWSTKRKQVVATIPVEISSTVADYAERLLVMKATAAWIPCPEGCGEFLCRIHGIHAFECECPVIDEWGSDPYTSGYVGDSASGYDMRREVDDDD